MTKADRINYYLEFGCHPYGEVARLANASIGYVSTVMNSREDATVRQEINDKKYGGARNKITRHTAGRHRARSRV